MVAGTAAATDTKLSAATPLFSTIGTFAILAERATGLLLQASEVDVAAARGPEKCLGFPQGASLTAYGIDLGLCRIGMRV